MTINRLAEIQEAISGMDIFEIYKECKSDYTDGERRQYAHNRLNGVSPEQAHQFIWKTVNSNTKKNEKNYTFL